MDENATTPIGTPDASQPKKYIRTFAGDMETLQEGGIPDLAPLSQPRAAPLERLVAASSIAPTPPPPSPESPLPEPVPAYTPAPSSEAPIKTYAGDFSERMRETRASTVTVLAAEQDSLPRASAVVAERPSPSGLLYVIAGAILLVAGVAGTYIAYTRYLAASAPIAPTANASAPIFVDDREQISGSGSALLGAIELSVARSLAPSTIRLLYVASTSAGSVFSALPLSAPAVLLRNVNADGSMAGVVNTGGSQHPFFILSVSSYSNTFAGMLAWEAMMPRSLGALFPAYPSVPAPATTTQPTATTTRTSGLTPSFRDEVVGNHDVRVYRDETGRSVMLYGYWNQTTLVIARDPAAFTEILGRLATSRTQP